MGGAWLLLTLNLQAAAVVVPAPVVADVRQVPAGYSGSSGGSNEPTHGNAPRYVRRVVPPLLVLVPPQAQATASQQSAEILALEEKIRVAQAQRAAALRAALAELAIDTATVAAVREIRKQWKRRR